jgi:hypothetical protein
MADKEFTYSEVSAHATKKDIFLVVHDKVYNASSFVDEHPYVLSRCPLPILNPSSGYQNSGDERWGPR